MLLRVVAPFSALLLAAGQISAQAGQCADQVMSRGNNVTGRTLSVSQEYPGVAAAALFESLRASLGAGSGQLGAVQIVRSDPARGVISGSVTPRGAARPVVLEVSVAALPNGNAQVSLTNRLPAAMLVNSRDWAASTCAFLATIAAAGQPEQTSPTAGMSAATPPGQGTTSEARAAAAGLAYREVMLGILSRPEEIDRFRLREAAAGDTVRVWSRDPRERAPEGLSGWHHPELKASVRDEGAGRTLPEFPAGHVILAGTGPFEIRVESESPALQYLVQVHKSSNRPEHVSSRIITGDTVRGEVIDYPRDTDEFHFTGRAGEEIQVYLGDHRSLTYAVFRRRAGARDQELPRGSAGIIRLPADGTYVLSVGVAFLGTEYNMTGPYWFRLRRRD